MKKKKLSAEEIRKRQVERNERVVSVQLGKELVDKVKAQAAADRRTVANFLYNMIGDGVAALEQGL